MKKLGINFWRIALAISVTLNIFIFFARKHQSNEFVEFSKVRNSTVFKVNEIKLSSLALDCEGNRLIVGEYYYFDDQSIRPVKKKILRDIRKNKEVLSIMPFLMLDDLKNEIFSGECLVVLNNRNLDLK